MKVILVQQSDAALNAVESEHNRQSVCGSRAKVEVVGVISYRHRDWRFERVVEPRAKESRLATRPPLLLRDYLSPRVFPNTASAIIRSSR
jgi:hypothetical protein